MNSMLLGEPIYETKHRLQICSLARIPAEQTRGYTLS